MTIPRHDREFDAVVVGGGLAGLAATYRLAANGLSVALVEKRERLGGSSAMSGGWFALSGTALQRRCAVAIVVAVVSLLVAVSAVIVAIR